MSTIIGSAMAVMAKAMGMTFWKPNEWAYPADLTGLSKRTGGNVARDKRATVKARNQKRHKRASK